MVMGHSEGGGAALWAAALGPEAAKGCALKGAIALAPVGPGVLKLISDLANGTDTRAAFPLIAPEVAAYLAAATVLGAQASDPAIDIDKLVAVRGILRDAMPNEALYGGLARAGLPCATAAKAA